MRVRRLARWTTGLVAAAAFGAAAILGVTAASADEIGEPTPAEDARTGNADSWD